jgi:hypothetical protein
MTTIKRATIKSYNPTTHKATVQIAGSLSVWLADVPVAMDIAGGEVVAGRDCAVLFLSDDNPDDAVVLAVQGAAPATAGTAIRDLDADTEVHTEKNSDEDKIRATVAGVLRMLLQTASPHLTFTGDVEMTERLGVNVAPSDAARLAVSQGSDDVNPTAALYDVLLVTVTGAIAKALTRWGGISFTGTLTVAGFNVTSILGLNFTPTVSFNTGAGSYTNVGGANIGVIVTGAGAPTITNLFGVKATPATVPAGHTVSTRRSLWAAAAAAAVGGTLTTDVGLDIDPPLGGASNNFVLRALGTAVPSLIRHPLLIGGSSDTDTPATSAILDLESTTGALLVPRMTTTQRDALTPLKGMIVYNTTLDQFQGYQGAVPAWVAL